MARAPINEARLKAIAAAKKLHRALDSEARLAETGGLVDVFEAIAELDIDLIFKPLNTALGLCLPLPLRGIMITTKRGLHIQRFTAAHELGHVILNHSGSIDREILERGAAGSANGRDIQEVEADAFASEFLLPRWLYRHHIRSQGWTVANLRNPDIVYQLSLRMGASYEATCWGLLGHQILPRPEAEILVASKVAQLKRSTVEEFKPDNSWSNVWKITLKDSGNKITGNPDDLIKLELQEDSGSGFQWNADELRQRGYQILDDQSSFDRDPLLYGASSKRVLVLKAPTGANKLSIQEKRPWEETSTEEDANLTLSLELAGPEVPGLSRVEKKRRGATE